jgi:hypothetical protein
MRSQWLFPVTAATFVATFAAGAGADGYEMWSFRIGMQQDHIPWGSDSTNLAGAVPWSTGQYDGSDASEPGIADPQHDLAWIFLADRGGDGGWDEFTGEYEEYPSPGLMFDMRAPYGPGTEQPNVRKRTWAVELHAPNGPGYVWRLFWEINTRDGYRLPEYPFVVRILPNETFPERLDLTSYGDGVHYIRDIPQWGPEPRIWLIEASIIPEPSLTWLAAAIPLVAIALRRRFGVR